MFGSNCTKGVVYYTTVYHDYYYKERYNINKNVKSLLYFFEST